LDAFFIVAGAPVAAVAELVSSGAGVELVSIAGPEIDKLRSTQRFFTPDVIPAGTYQGVGEVKTIAVNAQWVTSAKQPEAVVYEIVKAVYSDAAQKALAAGHSKGKMITLSNAVMGAGIPFHPGAAKFYKEKGLLK
jgi:TRAP transporter TAXI family solute receptor